MKKGGYGEAPKVLGHEDIEFPEFMFYLYLPIKLAGEAYRCDNLPRNLSFMSPLLSKIEVEDDDYVYVTAKNMWFEKGQTYNRDGWHSDGFMTDDKNYIWCDTESTEFMLGEFDLTQEHETSLEELENRACVGECDWPAPMATKTLLQLDQYVIHRPPPVKESGMRGFVKISVSKNKYDLKGNSHNHMLDYDWEMCDRKATRNDPVCELNK